GGLELKCTAAALQYRIAPDFAMWRRGVLGSTFRGLQGYATRNRRRAHTQGRRHGQTAPLDSPYDALGERDRVRDHGGERARDLQRLPRVCPSRRDLLLLSIRAQAHSRLAHLWWLAGWRAQLALCGHVGAGDQRADLPGIHLPARRVARSGAAAR